MAFDIRALTPKEQISLIYIGYFDRAPEPAGLNFWEIQLEESLDGSSDGVAGMDLEAIATDFSTQQETRDVYDFFDPGSTISAGNFLTNVYLNLFGRLPDSEGLQFWTNVLNNGDLPVGEVILEIIGGAQGSDILVLENKLSVAIDWHDTAEANGVFIPDAAGAASAASVLDGVTADPATVVTAKAQTADFFNTAPVAGNEFVTIDEDGVINGDVGDNTSDADGDTLTHSVEAGDGASNGTVVMNADGTYTYTPNADFNGTDSFTYTVKDGKGGVDTATVNVTVAAVNDAPVAQAAITTTAEDNSVSGSVTSSDVDGGTPTYSVSGNPANGSVTMNPNGTYTYTPNDDFNGSDSFEYTVSDGQGGVDTATVNVTVTAVDDAPVAQDESASVNEDAFILNGQLDANDIDNDNANITFALNAAAPAGLTLLANGSYSFDASVAAYQSLAAGVTQVVTAGYTATSNGKSDTGTITITVTGTNDAPVAQAAAVSTVEDTTISGTLSATDKDNGDTLTYSLATGAANGAVTVNQNGSFVYDPNADFNGVDSFTYTVTDSAGATSTATVNIGVSAVDDVLTSGVDGINGGDGDDIVIGNENTLNAGDVVNGGDGNDTVIVNVNTSGSALNFGGFTLNVETFQTTVDGGGSATFDMSSSTITGNTFVNSNSTGDLVLNAVNMTAGGTNGDDNLDGLPDDLVSLELRNVTNNANTTVTTRPAQVSGSTDAANILVTNVDSNADIGEINFYNNTTAMGFAGIETFNLSTAGSPQKVFIEDINTPGASTLNISADSTGLLVGDTDDDLTVDVDYLTDPDDGAVGIKGFDNAISSSILTVNASGSTGGVELSVADASSGANVTGGAGADILLGGSFADVMSGGAGDDAIDGNGGNDSLLGEAGDDVLFGGAGNDTLEGGDDDDMLFGESGNDVLLGGAGNDYGNTGTGAGVEFADMGDDDDVLDTAGAHLVGRDPGTSVASADQLDGGAGIDVLNINGSNPSTEADGLNDVQAFETINLNSGTFEFTIGDNSVFEGDHDARVAAGGADGSTTIDGSNAGNDVDVDASTLDEAITLIGGVGDDALTGGRGNDKIQGNAGDDFMAGGQGDDTFVATATELDGGDTIEGDAGDDTILVTAEDGRTSGSTNAAHINANVSGIQTIKVDDQSDVINEGDLTINFDNFDNVNNSSFTHDGVLSGTDDPRVHVDGSDMDAGESLTVNMAGNGFDEDIQVTGGAGDDTIIMGAYLDSGDEIDGGAGFDDVVISEAAVGDFSNVSNIECITVSGMATGTLVFGADAEAAFAAGVTPIIKLAPGSTGLTIDTTAFIGPVIIEDNDGSHTFNTGGGADTIIAAEGSDTFNTGDGADTIVVSGGDLDASDVLNTGAGIDTVEMDNSSGAVTAVSNLNTNATVENYILTDDGDINTGIVDADDNSLTFENGSVGTITPINVNATALTDPDDTFTVTLAANQLDADFEFNVEGSSTGDTFEKRNDGVNNNIDFNGNNGDDNFILNGADAGSTTVYDGGIGTDSLTISGGAIIDDGFTSISNVETLAAEVETYGFEDGLGGWATLGTATTRPGGSEGSQEAILFGGGTFVAGDIETFLGVASGSIAAVTDGGSPTNGSAMKRTVMVNAGDVVSFDFNFSSRDGAGFPDLGVVLTVNGTIQKLADTVNPGGNGWQTASFVAPTTGMVEIGFAVLNADDNIFDPQLLVDNVQIGGAALDATLGANALAAGIENVDGSNLDDSIIVDPAFTGDLNVTLGAGDDVFNAGAASGSVTLTENGSNIDGNDIITGGSGTGDVFNIDLDGNADAANLTSGIAGFETINLVESDQSVVLSNPGGPNTYTIVIGDLDTDNAGDALTINESGFEGETLNVDASAHTGNITYNGENDSAVSNVTTGSGNDTVNGGSLGDTLITNGGNDVVNGEAGNDTINSGSGDDIVNGGTDNDVIDGGTGSDTIDGGAGDDIITGGADGGVGDVLTGGIGADDFRYVNRSDSDGLVKDTITDFVSGTDQILIEENVLDQAGGMASSVNFIGNAPNFAQAQGAIGATGNDGVADWVFQAANATEAATIWVDVNDDGVLNGLDLQIEVPGLTSMQAADLFLTDTIPPAAPTDIDLLATSDSGTSDSDDLTNIDPVMVRVSFNTTATDGTAARAGNVLTLSDDGVTQSYTLTATDIANGYADISVDLEEGANDLSATITDTTGNTSTSSASLVVTLDTTAPTIAITTPIEGDDVVNAAEDNDVLVEGTTDAEDGQTVTVTFTDSSSATVTATAIVSAGAWTILGSEADISALANGTITVTADVDDAAGNPATPASTTVELDNVAPTVAITTPIEGDDVVNAAEDNDVLVEGTTDAEDGQTVTVTFDDGVNPVVTATATVSAGAWTLLGSEADISALANGTITVTADVDDAAGNPATPASTTVELDNVAPTIGISMPIEGDNVVNAAEDNDVLVMGGTNAEDGQTVTVTFDDGVNPVVTATATVSAGAWTLLGSEADISALANGTITVTADVDDAAGNPATPASTTVELDNVAPTIAITTPIEGDDVVNAAEDNDVLVEGTTDAEDGQTVTVTFTDSSSATVTATAIVSAGAWTILGSEADISALANGTITVTADVDDAAGNPATPASTTVELDNMPPATPTITLNSDTGTVDNVTDDPVVNVAGLEPTGTWQFSLDNGVTFSAPIAGTTTTFNLTNDTSFAAGTVQVRQTDAAGNMSGVGSNGAAWQEDSTDPTITSGTAGAAVDENAAAGVDVYTPASTDASMVTYAISGGADAGSFVIDGAGNLETNASFDYETQTTYSVELTATDQAGNTSVVTVTGNINDLNDNTPVATLVGTTASSFTINTEDPDTVGTTKLVTAVDGVDAVNSSATPGSTTTFNVAQKTTATNTVIEVTDGANLSGPVFTLTQGTSVADTMGAPASGSGVYYGFGGDDNITGGGFDDIIYGGADNDTIDGGAGDDKIDGGTGDDTVIYDTADVTTNNVDGGSNTAVGDTIDASGSGGSVSISLISGVDAYISFENITGSAFNDFLTGDAGPNVISGGGGSDVIEGGGSADALTGGTGADRFVFREVTDGGDTLAATINAAAGDNITDFIQADDTIAFTGALRTAIDDSAGGLISFTTANNGDGVATNIGADAPGGTEAVFVTGPDRSIAAGDLDDYTSVINELSSEFNNTAGTNFWDMLVVIESTTAGTFGVYQVTDAGSGQFDNGDNIALLGIVTGDAVNTTNFILA